MARRNTFQAPILTRSSKRQTIWGLGPESNGQNASSSQKFLWSNGIILQADSMATIVRTRGSVLIFLNAVDAAAEGFVGALGLGIVSDEAFAAGAASVPGPLNVPEWPGWIWHSYFHILAAANIGEGTVMQRIEIDSKAMRKIKSGETMIGVAEVEERGDGATMALNAQTRMLFKLT